MNSTPRSPIPSSIPLMPISTPNPGSSSNSRRSNSTGSGGILPTQLFPLRRHTTAATTSTSSTNSNIITRTSTISTTSTSQKLNPNLRLLPPTPVTLRDLKKLNQLILPVSYPPSFYKEPLLDALTSMVTRVAYWGGGDGLGDRERGMCVGGVRCRVEEETISVPDDDEIIHREDELDPITRERKPKRLRPNSTYPPPPSSPPLKKTVKIYIMTLAVRSPYRHLGIGSALINYLLELPGSVVIPSSCALSTTETNSSAAFSIYSTPSLPPPPPQSTFTLPAPSPTDLILLKSAVEIYAHVWEDNEDAIEWYAKRGFDVDSGGVVTGYYRKLKPDGARVVKYRWGDTDGGVNQGVRAGESGPGAGGGGFCGSGASGIAGAGGLRGRFSSV